MLGKIIEETARFIWEKRPWLVLTGAGVSTESGIPDFRSPGSGLWENHDPMEILSTRILWHKPQIFYQVGFPILMGFKNAQPNPAHQVLALWEQKGIVKAVVTQNIDSLHFKAGSRRVLEIHGHLRTGHCQSCRQTYPIEVIEEKVKQKDIPPHCSCGGIIRPDVVLFGDMLPPSFTEAEKLSHQFPLLVVGSSLQVSPANFLPAHAPFLVIVNLSSTPFDARADYLIRGKAGEVLTRINEIIEKLSLKDPNGDG